MENLPRPMIIQEQALEKLLQCPLMAPTGPSNAETCANALASWVLRQSFEGKLLGIPTQILHNIRGKMIELWDGNKLEAGALSRTAAFRLFNLVLDYEVVHLEQPYNLVLSGYTIQGKYALLQKRKGECLPHVLVLHTTEPELKRIQTVPPDVISLARYCHVYINAAHKDARVLHFPIFRGKPWMNKGLNVALAEKYLQDMLRVASLRPQYPVPGEHCTSCATKPCLGVFSGQDNDSRDGR